MDFLEWAQSEVGRWWWATIGGVVSIGLVTWRWLHRVIVTRAIDDGDRAVIARLDESLREYEMRMKRLDGSNDDILRDVERLRTEMGTDVTDIRADIKVVRHKTDEHAILLSGQKEKVDSIHEMVTFLRDKIVEQNGSRG